MITAASTYQSATGKNIRIEMEESAVPKQRNTDLASLLESDSFLKLDPTIQKQIISAVKTDNEKSGGLIGKLLGIKRDNLAIHAILIICLALLLLIVLDNLHAYFTGSEINMELVNIIIPVITLAIGYIIGNSAKCTH